MLQFLFPVILSEMCLIMVLAFKTPLRKLVVMGLDRVKRGRGPIVVKTVVGTVFAVMMSSVYNAMMIQKRLVDDGAVNPTDQVLMAQHLLDATLMGASIFLVLMIDRVHHYMRELQIRRKSVEAVRKQGPGFDNGKTSGSGDIKALEEEIVTLKARLMQLESKAETEGKDINAAEATPVALRKQSEGIETQCKHLIEENQKLRKHLKHLDRKSSLSPTKKNS